MRKILTLAVCFILLSAATARAEMNVAVFDLQEVASKSDVLKEGQAAIKKEFDPRKTKLDASAADLQTKANAVAAANSTEQQRTEFLNLQRKYNEQANTYVADLQKAELRVRKDVDIVIIAAAKTYAQKKGYTLILDTQAAIYFEDSMNVTKDMITEVNAQWRSMKK